MPTSIWIGRSYGMPPPATYLNFEGRFSTFSSRSLRNPDPGERFRWLQRRGVHSLVAYSLAKWLAIMDSNRVAVPD